MSDIRNPLQGRTEPTPPSTTIAEFDTCRLRHADAASLFDDQAPTLRYLAVLDAWLARAREEARQAAIATVAP